MNRITILVDYTVGIVGSFDIGFDFNNKIGRIFTLPLERAFNLFCLKSKRFAIYLGDYI